MIDNTYNFNDEYDCFPHELMEVVVTIELSQVLTNIVDVLGLNVLIEGCFELGTKFLVGRGLIPEICHVVL